MTSAPSSRSPARPSHPVNHPESGLAPSKLDHVQRHLRRYVDNGQLPGYACLVRRRGHEALFTSHGQRDVERNLPITRDTLFRIYSMTKPITSVAMMTLYEQGAFQLDDPVAKYIPSWANLKVYEGGDPSTIRTKRPDRAMTIKDLLTHTSGLTYGFLHAHPVDALYRKHKIGGIDHSTNLQDMIDALAQLPLQFSPGTRWNYSVATDVLGYLVQQLSDQPLDEYIKERITNPLGMSDTGFQVPAGQQERFAACYQKHPTDNRFNLLESPLDSPYTEAPKMLSGGGGMVSTIDDYQRFADMLLNRGNHSGHPILGRKTLEYMTLNHLPNGGDLASMGQSHFAETSFDGIGFGLGFSVVINPADANVLDSMGEFAWGGAASTYFWVDPEEELTVIFMTQLMPSSAYPIRRQLKALVYQAIID